MVSETAWWPKTKRKSKADSSQAGSDRGFLAKQDAVVRKIGLNGDEWRRRRRVENELIVTHSEISVDLLRPHCFDSYCFALISNKETNLILCVFQMCAVRHGIQLFIYFCVCVCFSFWKSSKTDWLSDSLWQNHVSYIFSRRESNPKPFCD